MSIPAPSQYLCDQMKPGDVIYVKYRPVWYRLYRKYFEKSKIKINVIMDWNTPNIKKEHYQEDCILIYNYEIRCMQIITDKIPCKIRRTYESKKEKQIYITRLEVSLYNITMTLQDGKTIVFPITALDNAISSNKNMLKQISSQEVLQEQLQFQKYKGDYFKNYVKNNKIKQWVPSYCNICGKPTVFKFKANEVDIDCRCVCGNIRFINNKMSYDELSVFYTSQTNKIVKNRYKDFWFKERE